MAKHIKRPPEQADDNDRDPAEAEWWDEDAERLERMATLARLSGVTVKVGAKVPKLNPDGSDPSSLSEETVANHLASNWCNQHGGDTCGQGEKETTTGPKGAKEGEKKEGAKEEAKPGEPTRGLLSRISARVGKILGGASKLLDKVPGVAKVRDKLSAAQSKVNEFLDKRYGKTASAIIQRSMLYGPASLAGIAAGLKMPGVPGFNDVIGLAVSVGVSEAVLQGSKAVKAVGKGIKALGKKLTGNELEYLAHRAVVGYPSLTANEEHLLSCCMIEAWMSVPVWNAAPPFAKGPPKGKQPSPAGKQQASVPGQLPERPTAQPGGAPPPTVQEDEDGPSSSPEDVQHGLAWAHAAMSRFLQKIVEEHFDEMREGMADLDEDDLLEMRQAKEGLEHRMGTVEGEGEPPPVEDDEGEEDEEDGDGDDTVEEEVAKKPPPKKPTTNQQRLYQEYKDMLGDLL